MTPASHDSHADLDSLSDDELERRIGLWLDSRLDAAAGERFARAVDASPRARRIRESFFATRRALAAVPAPPSPSRDLLGRTLERVAAARVAKEREILVLPWIRGVAVAAALMIPANALMFRSVRADSDASSVPTVEDQFRADRSAETAPDGLADYLAWYFLGRGR